MVPVAAWLTFLYTLFPKWLVSFLRSVKVRDSRFQATEGYFDPNIFGFDNLGIHHLVEKAIKAAGVDNRRELCRNILLSGGSTKTRGE